MSVCATNTVVFDARKVSHSRRKLADNERWAMLNKKTFQEILNALLAQSTSQPSSTATALTFALGQRSGSASNKSSKAPNGRTTMKGREYDLSGDRRAPKDGCTATSSNLESDETSASVGRCLGNDDDDDDDDYDLEIKDRCAREATDNLHSLPASAAASAAAAGSPFIIGCGGGTGGQSEFILGQSNLAGVGENLKGVGIFIVCAAMPPSADTSQYHFAARLLEGATTATRNAIARQEECMPQAPSLDAAAFRRTGSEAVSGVTSECIAQNALPRFRLGEKYEKVEGEEGVDEGGSCERIDRPYIQRHGTVLRPALPVRNRSRVLNGFHPSPRSFDLNKVPKICSRRLCFSAGKPGLNWMRRLNADQTSQVPAASESFTSDFAQTSTTLSTETSRTSNGCLSAEIRSTSDDSNTEIRSTRPTASYANPKHASAEFILRRGTDVAERTQTKNSITSESTRTCCAVIDLPFSPAHVVTSRGGILTEISPTKDKTNVAIPNRTTAPQGAAGVRHSEQSLSLSWSRWMAVDKDVLFCIIEHVLNAEAVAFNSGYCFKTPAPTRKAFSTARPTTTDFEKLPPDSSWRNNLEHLQWAALFRSSQLGGIFEETGNSQFPVEPRTRNRPETVLGNRTTENVMESFVRRVENNADAFVNSQDPRGAKRRDGGDSASAEISRRLAHFRLGRAAVGEKQRHRGTGKRHVAGNRKRKCFQYLSGSGFADRAPESSSAERETDQNELRDDDVDRDGDGISREKGVSSFKWKSKMIMRLRVE